MTHYQYLTKDRANPDGEFWVCENCRKKNNSLILEGKWRLIGKQENSDRICNECLNVKRKGSGSGKGQKKSPRDGAGNPKQ